MSTPAESFQRYAIEGLPNTPANLEWLRQHFACEQCGRCCRVHGGIRITRADAERLARRTEQSLKDYTATVSSDGDTFIMPQPCRYLVGNCCMVHDIKPSVCRKYPFQSFEQVDHDTAWVVITGCPGAQKLLKPLTSGKQAGLEYREYKTNKY